MGKVIGSVEGVTGKEEKRNWVQLILYQNTIPEYFAHLCLV